MMVFTYTSIVKGPTKTKTVLSPKPTEPTTRDNIPQTLTVQMTFP